MGMVRPAVLKLWLLALVALTAPAAFAQDPGPPPMPGPGQDPGRIPVQPPDPVQEPFPTETDAEKIQRLTAENEGLRTQVSDLQGQVAELNNTIQELWKIIREQIQVMMGMLSGS